MAFAECFFFFQFGAIVNFFLDAFHNIFEGEKTLVIKLGTLLRFLHRSDGEHLRISSAEKNLNYPFRETKPFRRKTQLFLK